ncbi:MAG: hypothetical protein Q4E86_01060 [Lachnospiraceae bacterium]|nr:hypothetical protein [Lachnospiraceae bacterium]
MYYLFLKSALHSNTDILESKCNSFFSYFKEQTGIDCNPASPEKVCEEPVSIVYIATGGTAGLFKAAAEHLKAPYILITSGSDNSLSASMEILTWLTDLGKKAILIHGTKEEMCSSLSSLLLAAQAKQKLSGMRLGIIGAPSDWLISTELDYSLLNQRLGLEIVQISMAELLDEISKNSYEESADTLALMKQDFDPDTLAKALEIYGAFSRIVQKHNLQGFTVRCFDLLTSVNNTGCLGLSLLNKAGIYSGCEGDLPSLISMVILGEISKQPVFQCNPSRANKETNDLILAHCTVPLNMITNYYLDTHFESGIGVAIAGELPSSALTIFKSNKNLNRYFASKAYLKQNLHEPDLCRTQISIHCEESLETFFSTPVGNHYLVCIGDYSKAIHEFFHLLEQ